MFVQDKIADMLTRIRNANQMRYATVEVIGTKMTLGIAEILKSEGYIADYVYEKNSNSWFNRFDRNPDPRCRACQRRS